MNEARDLAATRIAASQRTMVSVAQLAECGMGKDAIAHRVRSGRLHPEFHGVYSVGCGALPPFARELGRTARVRGAELPQPPLSRIRMGAA